MRDELTLYLVGRFVSGMKMRQRPPGPSTTPDRQHTLLPGGACLALDGAIERLKVIRKVRRTVRLHRPCTARLGVDAGASALWSLTPAWIL